MIFSIRMQINGFPGGESFARASRKCAHRAKITAKWKFRAQRLLFLFLSLLDSVLVTRTRRSVCKGNVSSRLGAQASNNTRNNWKIGCSWSAPMITYWISCWPHVSLSSGFHYKLHSVRLPSALSPCSLLNYCGQPAVASPIGLAPFVSILLYFARPPLPSIVTIAR